MHQLHPETSALSSELLTPSPQPLTSWGRGGFSQRQTQLRFAFSCRWGKEVGSRLPFPTQVPRATSLTVRGKR